MKQSIPLVSICIPTYNSEKWIQETIQSALSQTWKNKEIIIIDDGSIDNTFQIAKEYESKILSVTKQSNSGACAARNKALSIAQGDFIQWLDADDLLAPNKIEEQLIKSDLYTESRILHSSAWTFFYFRIRNIKFIPNLLWQDLSPTDWLTIHFGKKHMMPNNAWLVSRELTELVGNWDERLIINQDGEYFSRVVASSSMINFHPSAKCYYRTGNFNSISKNRSRKASESLGLSLNLCTDYLLNLENSERTRKASINLLNRFLLNLKDEKESEQLKNTVQQRIIDLGGIIERTDSSLEFKLINKLFGYRAAKKLKSTAWNVEIFFKKNWDRVLFILNL